MKKIILTVVCSLMVAAAAQASNELVIHMTSGAMMRYVLIDDEPVISFQNDSICVTTKSTVNLYPMERVAFFNYDNVTPTSIEGVGADNGMVAKNGKFIFSGLPAGSKVAVYDTAGKEYIAVKVDGEGKAELSLNELADGVYVIKTAKFSSKITKR